MERKYKLTREEIAIVQRLNNQNIPTGDIPEFQKFFLELKRNIILGGNSQGRMFGITVIDDDLVNITLYFQFGNILSIEPRPLVDKKPKLSSVIDKLLLQIDKRIEITELYINDIVIDQNSLSRLIKEKPALTVNFNNCYFSETVIMPVFYASLIKFSFCSLPNFNVLSKIGVIDITLDKCRIRGTKNGEININAKSLFIYSTSFHTPDLFYRLSMPNLESMVTNSATLRDADLILLKKIAPRLKSMEINATIHNLNTLRNINILDYYQHRRATEEYEVGSLNTIEVSNIERKNKIQYSLKNQNDLRKKIIYLLEESITSFYLNEQFVSFFPKEIFLQSIEKKITELENSLAYKLSNYIMNFSEYIDSEKLCRMLHDPSRFLIFLEKYLEYQEKKHEATISRLRSKEKIEACQKVHEYKTIYCYDEIKKIYEELSIDMKNNFSKEFLIFIKEYAIKVSNSNIDQAVKDKLLYAVESFKLDLNQAEFLTFKSLEYALHSLFLPIYRPYNELNIFAKAYAKELSFETIKNSTYYAYMAHCEVEKMKIMLRDFKNTRKKNFELLDVLALAGVDEISNLLLRDSKRVASFESLMLSNHQLCEGVKLINKNCSCTTILSELGFDHFDNRKEYFLTESESALIIKKNDDTKIELKNKTFFSGDELLSYIKFFQKKGIIGDLLNTYYDKNSSFFKKYQAVEREMNLRKDIPSKNRFELLFGADSNLNEADFTIYQDIVYNAGKSIKRKVFFLVKAFSKECIYLTNEDYAMLNKNVKLNYSRDSFNEQNLLLEVIKHLTGKYPSFIERYLGEVAHYDYNEPIIFNAKNDIDEFALDFINKIMSESKNVADSKILKLSRIEKRGY